MDIMANRGVTSDVSSSVRHLTAMLPVMTPAEALETTHIHGITGRTGARTAWVTTCPLRAPHHTFSDAGLSGSHLVKNAIRLSR